MLGDAIDLAVLGRSLRSTWRASRRSRLFGSMGAVLAVTALDILTARVFTQRPPTCSLLRSR